MLARTALLATIAPVAAAWILAPAAYAVAPAPTTFQSIAAEQSYTVPAGVTGGRVEPAAPAVAAPSPRPTG